MRLLAVLTAALAAGLLAWSLVAAPATLPTSAAHTSAASESAPLIPPALAAADPAEPAAPTQPREGPRPAVRAGSPAAPSGAAGGLARAAESRVRLRVLDASGAPVAGAQIEAWSQDPAADPRVLARCDAQGWVEVPALEPLRVCARGWATRVLSPPRGGSVVVLSPARALRGQALSAEDGQPLPDAFVEAWSDTWSGRARCDATGHFVLPDAPEGEAVRAWVGHPRRLPESFAGGLVGGVVRLRRGAALRGVVRDAWGVPVVGAKVVAYAEDHPQFPTRARSDHEGRFELQGLPRSGRVALLAGTAHLASEARLEWSARSAWAEVQVLARAALTLSGLPPGRAELVPVDAPGADAARRLLHVEAGRSRVARLAPGRYRIESGGQALGPVFRVRPGSTQRFALPR